MHHVVFIGNPGTGKSTLLNSLIGQSHFKAGVSVGAGLTKVLQTREKDGVKFYDTPGLDDVASRETASEEIAKSLRKGGEFSVVFVTTLESGRVRGVDLATMDVVLKALEREGIDMKEHFSVIVNKCHSSILSLLDQPNVDVYRALFSRSKLVGSVLFFPEIESLMNQENTLLSDVTRLKKFVFSESPKVVLPTCPSLHVEADDMESKIAEMKRLIQELTDEIQAHKKNRNYNMVKQVLTSAVHGFSMGAGGAFFQGAAAAVSAESAAAAAISAETTWMAFIKSKAFRLIGY